MKNLLAKIAAIVNRPRVQHYLEIFAASTGAALWFQRDQLLGAHGMDAVGCIVFGATVAGGKAVLEAYRKGFKLPPVPAGK